MNEDLLLALSLADAADEITMKYFHSAGLAVRTKTDRTPVSEADEAVETMIREQLGRERSGDGIIGEEFGATGSSKRQWIVDPIDATRNYIRGVPVFATLLALEVDRKQQLGVVSAPAIHRRWWATRGDGAFCNGRRLRVSAVASIGESSVGYDSVTDFKPREGFVRLLESCQRSRGFGDFWIHMLVAEGALDVAVEPHVAHWDMAPVQIIVEEAGGRFTSFNGEPRPDGGSAVSSNGTLHDEVLRFLR